MTAGRLGGQVAIVTGGNRGIGRFISLALARAGARVVIAARWEEAAAQTIERIEQAGGEGLFVSCDVTDWTQVQQVAARTLEHFGGLDILVCNSGIFPFQTIEDMTPEEWDRVLDVNLKGTFLSVKACLPWMKDQKKGRIILISSITGPRSGRSGWSHYGASKAGMHGFMRSAALEVMDHGITINAIAPGTIATEEWGMEENERVRQLEAEIPMRRLGAGDEIADAVVYLSGETAGYMTGQVLTIDGGLTLTEVSSEK